MSQAARLALVVLNRIYLVGDGSTVNERKLIRPIPQEVWQRCTIVSAGYLVCGQFLPSLSASQFVERLQNYHPAFHSHLAQATLVLIANIPAVALFVFMLSRRDSIPKGKLSELQQWKAILYFPLCFMLYVAFIGSLAIVGMPNFVASMLISSLFIFSCLAVVFLAHQRDIKTLVATPLLLILNFLFFTVCLTGLGKAMPVFGKPANITAFFIWTAYIIPLASSHIKLHRWIFLGFLCISWPLAIVAHSEGALGDALIFPVVAAAFLIIIFSNSFLDAISVTFTSRVYKNILQPRQGAWVFWWVLLDIAIALAAYIASTLVFVFTILLLFRATELTTIFDYQKPLAQLNMDMAANIDLAFSPFTSSDSISSIATSNSTAIRFFSVGVKYMALTVLLPTTVCLLTLIALGAARSFSVIALAGAVRIHRLLIEEKAQTARAPHVEYVKTSALIGLAATAVIYFVIWLI